MSDFRRYAIYYVPDDASLAHFGATWLGWDVVLGAPCGQPRIENIGRWTETPRKYGFHGTVKPPFCLSGGMDEAQLRTEMAHFAAATAPVRFDGLSLAKIGHFLALVPVGAAPELSALAFECVQRFDTFRKPASEDELARRRSSGLTARQDELLVTWGYPYVAEEFRFHLTLTGRLEDDELDAASRAAAKLLPATSAPFEISSLALVGEREDGMFQLIHRYTLAG